MPRILRGSIVSLGNFAPIVATGTICPAATLVAAVAIVSVFSLPTSTVQSCSRSAFGCGSTFTSFPTTTPLIAGRVTISSTGKPRFAKCPTTASGSAGSST